MNPPGYKYLGPFNKLDKGKPTNELDAIAQRHDHAYNQLGIQAYFGFNQADQDFINEAQQQPGLTANFAAGLFGLKKAIAPHIGPMKRKGPDSPGEGTSKKGKEDSGIGDGSFFGDSQVDSQADTVPLESTRMDDSMNTSMESNGGGGPSAANDGGGGGGGGGGAGGGGPAGIDREPIQNHWFKHSANGRKFVTCIRTHRVVFKNDFGAGAPPAKSVADMLGAKNTPQPTPPPGHLPSTIDPVRKSMGTGPNGTQYFAVNAAWLKRRAWLDKQLQDAREAAKWPYPSKHNPLEPIPEEPEEESEDEEDEETDSEEDNEIGVPKKTKKTPKEPIPNSVPETEYYFFATIKYDWNYCDWNYAETFLLPQVKYYLGVDCAMWRTVGVHQRFHSFQFTQATTQPSGGTFYSPLQYGAFRHRALVPRRDFPWITTGYRIDFEDDAAAMKEVPKVWWSESPFYQPRQMWKVNLSSSCWPLPGSCLGERWGTNVNGMVARWNPPVMEVGTEITMHCQMDKPIESMWQGATEWLYNHGEVYTPIDSHVINASGITNKGQRLKACFNFGTQYAAFTWGRQSMDESVSIRPGGFQPGRWPDETQNALLCNYRINNPAIVTHKKPDTSPHSDTARSGMFNPDFPGSRNHHVPFTWTEQTFRDQQYQSDLKDQIGDYGGNRGRIGNSKTWFRGHFRYPFMTAAPIDSDVRNTMQGYPTVHGALPTQHVFRVEPMIHYVGDTTLVDMDVSANMYVQVAVTMEVVENDSIPHFGFAPYSRRMLDGPRDGGVNLLNVGTTQDMSDMIFNPLVFKDPARATWRNNDYGPTVLNM